MQLQCECTKDSHYNSLFTVTMDYGKNELVFTCLHCGEEYHASMLITISKVMVE